MVSLAAGSGPARLLRNRPWGTRGTLVSDYFNMNIGGVAGGMTDEADEFIKAVMADMLDQQASIPAP